jgi:hypothetical protein
MSGQPPGEWREPDGELLDALVSVATAAADLVAIAGVYPTEAERTRAIVRAALRFALANRLITVTPPGQWPRYRVIDPPPG